MTTPKVKRKNFLFHRYEVGFSGYSNTGKTTLVTKLIDKLSKSYSVGYVKHDAHRFEMDKEGKDTWNATKAGARTVCINSSEKSATLDFGFKNDLLMEANLLDKDIVLVEGHKKSIAKKFVLIDDDEKILEDFTNGDVHNVLAFIYKDKAPTHLDLPCFQRDDLSSILEFMMKYFSSLHEETPINALILGGGRSSRMKSDKGALEYHGKSQIDYISGLLEEHVNEVYVSCRSDQSELEHLKNYAQIHDRYFDFGPTGGILSAFSTNPNASWLVVACDLPFLTEETIKDLISRHNPFKVATCFENPQRKWPEPLCTIYTPKAAQRLSAYLGIGKPCPRKVLFNSEIELLKLKDIKALDNINTPSEFKETKNLLMEGSL